MDQPRIANDCGTSLTFEVFGALWNTMIASVMFSLNCVTIGRQFYYAEKLLHNVFFFFVSLLGTNCSGCYECCLLPISNLLNLSFLSGTL